MNLTASLGFNDSWGLIYAEHKHLTEAQGEARKVRRPCCIYCLPASPSCPFISLCLWVTFPRLSGLFTGIHTISGHYVHLPEGDQGLFIPFTSVMEQMLSASAIQLLQLIGQNNMRVH